MLPVKKLLSTFQKLLPTIQRLLPIFQKPLLDDLKLLASLSKLDPMLLEIHLRGLVRLDGNVAQAASLCLSNDHAGGRRCAGLRSTQ